MWRSKGIDFLTRCSRKTVPSVQNQVSSKTLTIIRSPSQYSLTILSRNPRFFSIESNIRSQNGGFDESLSFISQESDPSSVTLDENPSFISQQSESPSVIFDENTSFISQERTEGEIPKNFSQENGNGDEQMDSIVPEESVVEEIPEINIEQVESVLSVLQSSVDGSLESFLDKMDLNVNEEFVIRVIETPLVPGENLIGFVKWVWGNTDFSLNTRVVDSLVGAVGPGLRKRNVRTAYSLWSLVKEIGEKEKGVLNTEILNKVIYFFWKLGKGKAGLEVFNDFEELGCWPNADSYYLTIEALCRCSIFDLAWSVCEKMLTEGKLPDSEKIGNIISCLCKGSKAKDAHLVYLMAKEKNNYPPQSPVNFLISSLCKEDETVKLALDLLEDFSGDARKYAIKLFSTVVRGLCRIKDIEGAKKLLFKMIDAGPPPGSAVFNSVINGLSKAGEMEEAMGLVKVMESRGLRPDVYTYSVIMSGYAKGGQMEDAQRTLLEAKKNHSKLCPVTYHTLIRGYCKLEEFDKALELLNEMKEYGVQPSSDEYNKMIQSLCLKALDWGKAEKLLEEMKEKGLYLNGITRGLIRAVKELEEEELNAEGVSIEA